MSEQQIKPLNLLYAILGIIFVGGMVYLAWPEVGEKGGSCHPDGTCNMGLVCKSQICEVRPKGSLLGECRANGGCNDGLVCNQHNFCTEKSTNKSTGGGGRPSFLGGIKNKIRTWL